MSVYELKKQIVSLFFEYKIVMVDTQNGFKYTSGKTGPVYIDHRKIFSIPDLRTRVVHLWTQHLKQNLKIETFSNIIFAGTATAGIAPAYALAQENSCGFVYIRTKAKDHGTKSMIEGVVPENSKIIVVDDMVTTGGSILTACENIIQTFGKECLLCATSITRHNFNHTNQNFLNSNIHFESIFTSHEIFEIAQNLNIINKNEFDEILNWILTQEKK